MAINTKHWKQRSLFFLSGLLFISLGINITISSGFGVGGWDAADIGMVNHFGMSIGFWLNAFSCIYLLISSILVKERLFYYFHCFRIWYWFMEYYIFSHSYWACIFTAACISDWNQLYKFRSRIIFSKWFSCKSNWSYDGLYLWKISYIDCCFQIYRRRKWNGFRVVIERSCWDWYDFNDPCIWAHDSVL